MKSIWPWNGKLIFAYYKLINIIINFVRTCIVSLHSLCNIQWTWDSNELLTFFRVIISPSRWVTTTTAAQLCCFALLLKVSNTVSRFHFIWQDETISIKGKVHEWYTIRLRYRHSFGISEIWTSSDRLVIRVWYFFSKIWISYFRSEIGTYITDLRYFL